jgi:membrane protein
MIKNIRRYFSKLLWSTSLKKVSKPQAFFIRTLRIFYGAGRDLASGLPTLRATGLVYTTLLSIVPLLAVSFSVLKGFGAHNQLEPALTSLLEPLGEKGAQISLQIISFVDNMQVGVLGSLGLAFLIYTILSLVKKIETAFNDTWRISTTRNIVKRFSNYLSVILLGPVLLFAASGMTASFHSSTVINKLLSIEPFGSALLMIGTILPYILTVISFCFIYMLVPNTKVRLRSAFYGAVIAAFAWKFVGSLFTTFVVNSTNYTAIYSGFAIMIVFMIWIYLSWLIVLTGASFAYYHQNPERISNKSQVIRLSSRLREKLALTIMQMIANSFHNGQPAWSIQSLAKKTTISEPAINLIISALLEDNLLIAANKNDYDEDGELTFVPARSLENISVNDILNVARSAEETPFLRPDSVDAVDQVRETVASIEDAIRQTTSGISLKNLIQD